MSYGSTTMCPGVYLFIMHIIWSYWGLVVFPEPENWWTSTILERSQPTRPPRLSPCSSLNVLLAYRTGLTIILGSWHTFIINQCVDQVCLFRFLISYSYNVISTCEFITKNKTAGSFPITCMWYLLPNNPLSDNPHSLTLLLLLFYCTYMQF